MKIQLFFNSPVACPWNIVIKNLNNDKTDFKWIFLINCVNLMVGVFCAQKKIKTKLESFKIGDKKYIQWVFNLR
jgi:hypothetical protein